MKVKVLATVLATIAVVSVLVVCGLNIRNKYLRSYNAYYVQDYLDTVVVNYDIVDIQEWIYVPGILDGGHDEYVDTDYIDKNYSIEYIIHDNDIDYTYNIIFSHGPYKKITVSDYSAKEYQVKLYNKYNDNYEIMKNIIEENGGKSELVSKYCGEYSIDDYCIMMYVPSYKMACDIESKLYDNVYGGYALEHIDVTNGVNVDLPRYIITNNIDEYNTWLENIQAARDLFTDKKIESADIYLSEVSNNDTEGETENTEYKYVYTPDIVNTLHGSSIDYLNKYSFSYTTLSENMNMEIPLQWIITNEHCEYNELGYAEYVYSVGTMLLD
jgi:hypothetical protein